VSQIDENGTMDTWVPEGAYIKFEAVADAVVIKAADIQPQIEE
jgi:hypothetical protein